MIFNVDKENNNGKMVHITRAILLMDYVKVKEYTEWKMGHAMMVNGNKEN